MVQTDYDLSRFHKMDPRNHHARSECHGNVLVGEGAGNNGHAEAIKTYRRPDETN